MLLGHLVLIVDGSVKSWPSGYLVTGCNRGLSVGSAVAAVEAICPQETISCNKIIYKSLKLACVHF